MSNMSARLVHDKVSPTVSGSRTVSLHIDATINSLSLNRDATQVVVAGRNVIKIIGIDEEFSERINLRVGKNSLNYSSADVAWNHNDDHILASGATNGSVVIWDLNKKTKSKLDYVFNEHKRAVNRVCFHRNEAHWLLTAHQNGHMILFDMRAKEASCMFVEPALCNVRDIQFSPFDLTSFCAATENGTIQMWDVRRYDRYIWEHLAQSGPIYTIDWHPEERSWIATAGRDQVIKVWETVHMTNKFSIQTITEVTRIKWRPQRRYHIASCALHLDCNINVWDVRRPYIPFAAFTEHTDVAKAIVWKQDPHVFLSGGRDHVLIEHVFSDAKCPADHAIPAALQLGSTGHVTFAMADKAPTSVTNKTGIRINQLFKKSEEKGHQFLEQVTSSAYSTQSMRESLDELSMLWFVETAQRYLLTGHSLHHLCDYNAEVAESLSRFKVAQTWKSIKLLYPGVSGTKGHNKTLHSTPQTGDKSDTDKIRTSTVASHYQGSELEGTTSGASDDDSDSDIKLTHIASGVSHVNGHIFFGNDDMDMCYENPISNFDSSKTDLTLPLEGFHHRHEIHERSGPPEELQNGPDSPASANESDLSTYVQPQHHQQPMGARLLHTRSVVDEQLPRFSCSDLMVDMLTQFAEQGDVQSSVCMLLVLGSRIQDHIPVEVQELWYTSYIELLSRFELWNKANEVIKLTSVAEVSSMNQQSTTVNTKCNKCNKPLDRAGWLCTRCKTHTNPCSVCSEPVKGLYVWCQGCSHGGHLHHMHEWFQSHSLCPTGCGHLCEYT